jgi:rhodanese-related sulfurtransferase
MIKTLFGLLLLGSMLFAKVTNIPATLSFIEEKEMKVIDIRTKKEWIQMGIIKDSYLITFFDERYGYNAKKFLEDLNAIVKKNERFALICNTGSRTKLISNFLGKKHTYNVVNLTGGIMKLFEEGFKPEFYNPSGKRVVLKHTLPSKELLAKEATLQTPIQENNSTK